MNLWKRRACLLLALGVALSPAFAGLDNGPSTEGKKELLTGKIVALAELLAKDKTLVDADQKILVLHTAEGRIFPLLKDSGSRMFFTDAKLRNRNVRLTARKIPNSEVLQVINFKTIVNGKLHEAYYWCDICTIRRTEAGICDCCGAPLEFREEPWKGE